MFSAKLEAAPNLHQQTAGNSCLKTPISPLILFTLNLPVIAVFLDTWKPVEISTNFPDEAFGGPFFPAAG